MIRSTDIITIMRIPENKVIKYQRTNHILQTVLEPKIIEFAQINYVKMREAMFQIIINLVVLSNVENTDSKIPKYTLFYYVRKINKLT